MKYTSAKRGCKSETNLECFPFQVIFRCIQVSKLCGIELSYCGVNVTVKYTICSDRSVGIDTFGQIVVVDVM